MAVMGQNESKAPVVSAKELDREFLPRHVAIIMDGNGRWAQKRGLPRSSGHAAGTEALRAIIRACDDLKIEYMSIYAFSTENWNRPVDEVSALMNLILRYFVSEIDELDEKGVRIRILGDMRAFPIEQRQALEQAQVRTAHNDGLKLNIALNYGGRAELVRAAQKLGEQCARGETQPDAIDADAISAQLYTAGQPDVDLLIRTGGEERLSNFLLWQTWYAEIIFDSTYWPDFDRARLIHDLNIFASRDRRFGRVKRA